MKVKYEDLKFMIIMGSFNQDKYEAINIFDYDIIKNELNKIAKLKKCLVTMSEQHNFL